MENMPANVINKIYFCTTHPVAEIVKESGIFKALEQTNLKDDDLSWDFVYGRYDRQNRFGYKATIHDVQDMSLYTIGL
jgi:hypothetical protein